MAKEGALTGVMLMLLEAYASNYNNGFLRELLCVRDREREVFVENSR